MIYLNLFLAFLQICAFSFGGGYADMPLIQSQVVNKYGWITLSSFTDLITIAEMTPGPIAVNAATFVGNQVAGIPRAIAATIGVILPSCIFVTILARLYKKYRSMSLMHGILKSLRPAVVAIIFGAGLTILIPTLFKNEALEFNSGDFQICAALLFCGALTSLRVLKLSPIFVMIACGIIEAILQIALNH